MDLGASGSGATSFLGSVLQAKKKRDKQIKREKIDFMTSFSYLKYTVFLSYIVHRFNQDFSSINLYQ